MVRPHELVTLLKRTISCDQLMLIKHCWASNRVSATTWSVRSPGSPLQVAAAVPSTHALITFLWQAPLLDPTTAPGATNQILMVTGRRAPLDGLDGEAVGWQILRSRNFKPDDVALVRTVRSLFERPVLARTRISPARLTTTETAILVLIAEGCSASEIAHRRGQSVRTVHKHIENLYRKIGCHDRVHAARYAWRAGLIGFTPPDQSSSTGPDAGSDASGPAEVAACGGAAVETNPSSASGVDQPSAASFQDSDTALRTSSPIRAPRSVESPSTVTG